MRSHSVLTHWAAMSVDASDVEPARRRSALQGLVLGGPLLLLAERAWAWRWMSDDVHQPADRQADRGRARPGVQRRRARRGGDESGVGLAADGVRRRHSHCLEWLAVLAGIALTLGGLAPMLFGASVLARARRPHAMLVPAGAVVLVVLPRSGSSPARASKVVSRSSHNGAGRTSSRRCSASVPLIRPDFAVYSVIWLSGGHGRRRATRMPNHAPIRTTGSRFQGYIHTRCLSARRTPDTFSPM